MKVLLIDDERLARSELRRLLAAFPDVVVAGEAANARQARELLASLAPDLIFLDVQMPGESGLELLASLEPPVPRVIFTTAYDEFAAKAFELNALDYLLKPVDPARLAGALDKHFAVRHHRLVRQPVLDVFGQGGCRLIAIFRTQGHCLQADGLQRRRNLRPDFARSWKLSPPHILQHDEHVSFDQRGPAGE